MASTGAQVNTGDAGQKKKVAFRKTMFRGEEVENLLKKSTKEIVNLMNARQRRRYARKIPAKYERFMKKVRKAIKECPHGEKPKPVKTHLRNLIVTPDMVGGIVECYGGKYWNNIEVKGDMIGHYLAEFSLTYKPIRHGKVGVGATRSSKFTSLK